MSLLSRWHTAVLREIVVMWNNVDAHKSRKMTRNAFPRLYSVFIIIAISLFLVSPSLCIISDKRLCFDQECSVPVALAKTTTRYASNDPNILSFDINKNVTVYSKSAGKRTDLWGVEIDGKRGYVPKTLILEKKKLQGNLTFIVPTEFAQSQPKLANPIVTKPPPAAERVEASQVTPSFEVIDGTTINHYPADSAKPKETLATPVLPHAESAAEQPILTVHPHRTSSETPLSHEPTPELTPPVAETPETVTEDPVTQETPTDSISSTPEEPQPNPTQSETTKDPLANVDSTKEQKSLPEEPIAAPEAPPQEVEVINVTASEEKNVNIDSPAVEEVVNDDQVPAPNQDDQVNVPDPEKIKEEVKAELETQVPESNIEDSMEMPSNEVVDDDISDAAGSEDPPASSEDVAEDSEVAPMTSVDDRAADDDAAATESVLQENEIDVKAEVEETPVQESPATPAVPDVETPSEEVPETENIEENVEQVVQEEQAESSILSNAFDKVASLFDTLTTTEAPETAPELGETAEEAPSTAEDIIAAEELATEPQVNSTSETTLNETETHETNEILREEDPKTVPTSEINSTLQGQPDITQMDDIAGSAPSVIDSNLNFNKFPGNRNLLNVETGMPDENQVMQKSEAITNDDQPTSQIPLTVLSANEDVNTTAAPEEVIDSQPTVENQPDDEEISVEHVILESEMCHADNSCDNIEVGETIEESPFEKDDTEVIKAFLSGQNYWETLSYVALTAVTTLLFSLGYYYIENTRRDGRLIAKINKLEKELLISSKECTVLDETLKSTKNKLNSIEDESFGSNETVMALKTELEASYKAKGELEEQVTVLEKDLESATEAGLELERMLREILASKSAESPLAKSIEDLQARLSAQQSANDVLTNTLHLKIQENETLTSELATTAQKCEQLEVEILRINEELKIVKHEKDNLSKNSSQQIEKLEKQVKELSIERADLRKQLTVKNMEVKDLAHIVKQSNINSLDLDKLSDVSQIKAESSQLMEERDELKMKLSELEGVHELLEEHMRIINEEVAAMRDQCKLAEKEKDEAVTRLQVLSKFFQEKEEERKKEGAMWMQQQGEVSTTIEKLQSMQTEVQNYRQQIESLKREIVDQEREYKAQMTALEAKAHEQWVLARQSERRLEESKAEAGILRNRLTLIEKNLTEPDSDVKNHRSEANGESATSPQLFIGAEASSSPIMFSGPSNIPPPYMSYGPPLPPFLPPHMHAPPVGGFDVSQRPRPLGRLSSPPPMPSPAPPHPSTLAGRGYERSDSSPPSPPISPFPHYRAHPPLPPLPPLPMMPPGPLPNPPWGDDKPRNGFQPFHREQRTRDYKGSLESSAESLDKTHHGEKA